MYSGKVHVLILLCFIFNCGVDGRLSKPPVDADYWCAMCDVLSLELFWRLEENVFYNPPLGHTYQQSKDFDFIDLQLSILTH